MKTTERINAADHIAFVAYILKKHFHSTGIEYDDLFQIGCVGLVKAANHYDASRGRAFTTYATTCIANEVLMEIRRRKREYGLNIVSFDRPISADESIFLADIIPDSVDIGAECTTKAVVRQWLSALPEKKRQILLLSLVECEQKAIGQQVGMSQPYVSRIIKGEKKKLRALLIGAST